MSLRPALIGLAALLPFIALGLWLWDSQGTMVWLQGAIAYCF
jgi:hypothetical protein